MDLGKVTNSKGSLTTRDKSGKKSSKDKKQDQKIHDIIQAFNANLEKAANLLEQCLAYIAPVESILSLLEEAGFEIIEGLETLKQMKFFLTRMHENSLIPDKCDPNSESIVYLHAVVSRFGQYLFKILSFPKLSLNERARRYHLNQYSILVRMEARSAADKNDSTFDADTNEKKDFMKSLNDQLTLPDAVNVWQIFFTKNAEPSAVAWDNFFKVFEITVSKDEKLPINITPTEETILRKLITKTGIPYVTPHDFNEFLIAFGGGNPKVAYLNAVKMWRNKGFTAFFTPEDAEQFLIHEAEGTYILSLSAYAGYCFNLYVMTTELITWKISCDSKSFIYTAKSTGKEIMSSQTIPELLKKCQATTAFTVLGLNEAYLSNTTQEEVIRLLQHVCDGTYIVYTDDDTPNCLRISYKSLDTIKHLYVENADDTGTGYGFQLKWTLSVNSGKISFDKFPTLEALLLKHKSFLRFNFDFDGVPELTLTSYLIDKDNTIELIAPEMLFKGNFLTHREAIGAETSGGYPNGSGGELLCDRFHVKVYGDRLFFCLTDGCNWGEKPRAAAIKASQGFIDYVTEPKLTEDTRTTLQYRELILRGIRHAHNKIIEGIPATEIFTKCGRTTILAGAILPLDGLLKGEWAIVFASVGDCKLFLWNEESGSVDITYGNRINARDPGDSCGRVGPYVDGGQPDLRNLKTYFWNMTPEDIMLAVTDGVYDNLDPECLGLTPEQANVPNYTDWSLIPPEKLIDYKSFHLCVSLNLLLQQCKDKTPSSMAHLLVQNALAVTHKSRTWLEAHPNEPEPKNYSEFPGKMDHVTTVAITPGFSLMVDKRESFTSTGDKTPKRNNNKPSMTSKTSTKSFDKELTKTIAKADSLPSIKSNKLKKHAKKNYQKTALWKPTKKTAKGNENSTIACIYCPKEDETLVSQPNLSGWAVSTLPSERTRCSEFFSVEATPLRTLFGMSTSCTFNKFSIQTAEDALIRFMIGCNNILDKKDNILDFADSLVDIFEETNSQITSSIKQPDTHFHGMQNTTLLGGICFKHADEFTAKNGGKQWSTLLINVGNSKAFNWDIEKQELIDLCPNHHVTDQGCLGPYSVIGDDPNWANIDLYNFTCSENSVILVLSAGVLRNFDPIFLGDANVSDYYEENEKNSKLGIHNNLENLLRSVEKTSLVFEYSKAIFNHISRITKVRSECHATTGFAPKRRTRDIPGYLGHATCLAFRVGMTGDKESPPSISELDTGANRRTRRNQPERNIGGNIALEEGNITNTTSTTTTATTATRTIQSFYIGSNAISDKKGMTPRNSTPKQHKSNNNNNNTIGVEVRERKGLTHRSKTAGGRDTVPSSQKTKGSD